MSTLLDCNTAKVIVISYPIRDDGILIDLPFSGQMIAIDGDEVEFRLPGKSERTSSSLLIGLKQVDQTMAYMGVEIIRASIGANCQVISAVRGGIGEQILAEEGRIPVLNEEYRYVRSFPDEVYWSWQQAGILQNIVLDRVLVCPKCDSLPTFRLGCQRCRSGRIKQTVLVHHFACAFVGPLESFTCGESLKCPKCQTKHIIAGTDFEYAPSELQCQDCGWKSRELVQAGHCLRCETRFPLHQAVEQELGGYDVNRVDSLAIKSYSL